jgi:hypothetical protein
MDRIAECIRDRFIVASGVQSVDPKADYFLSDFHYETHRQTISLAIHD